MSKNTFRWRGLKFLAIIAATYVLVYLYAPHTALTAGQTSGAILHKVLPIIAIVITFTAIINTLLPTHIMIKHLGQNSGRRGWAIALCAGVISHGPMYIWYPMIEDLRQHGVRDGLLVAFFYSRAIKVPLLPLMIDYFGWGFCNLDLLHSAGGSGSGLDSGANLASDKNAGSYVTDPPDPF